MAISAAYLPSPTQYSATDARRAVSAGLAHNGTSAFGARNGVFHAYGNPFGVGAAGNLFLSVQPGQAVVDGQYVVTMDAAVNVTVDAGGSAPRWDAIVIRILNTESGDASSAVSVQVVKGTTTTIPALPARSLLLATVVVGTGVTSVNSSNIVDRRVWTAAQGGVIHEPGAAAAGVLDQGTPGTPVFDPVVNRLYFKGSDTKLRAPGSNLVAQGRRTDISGFNVGTATQFYFLDNWVNLPFFANTVLIDISVTVVSPGSTVGAIYGFFNNEYVISETYNTGGSGSRTMNYSFAMADQAAGVHGLCGVGVKTGLGDNITVPQVTYSYRALA